MGFRRLVFGALVGLGLATGASAAEPAPAPASEQLQKFMLRQDNHDAVVQLLETQWRQTVGTCDAVKPINWQAVVLTPVEFRGDGKPLGGAWREIVTSEGCGTRKIFSVVSLVQPDGSIGRVGMLPGTSRADMMLEKDAITEVRAAAIGVLPKDCKPIAIVDTAFVEEEGPPVAQSLPGHNPHPWREEWTVRGCDVNAIVTMHFVPTATGTNVNAVLKETRPG